MKAILFGLCIICTPIVVLGAPDYEYVPLVGIPGVEPGSGIEPYLNALYVIAISAAAFLAVGKLLLAGVQYILSDIVTKKENAKKDIRGALVGLLIVVSAVFILTIINPQLINLEALSGIKGIKVVPQQRAVAVVTQGDSLDTYDLRTMTPAQIQQKAAECTADNGDWIVNGGNKTGQCRGNVSQAAKDNVVNTQSVLTTHITNNPNLSAEEKDDTRYQYNTYVGPQEPNNITATLIEDIKSESDANSVLFIVHKNVIGTQNTALTEIQQEAVCSKMTNDLGALEIFDTVRACIAP